MATSLDKQMKNQFRLNVRNGLKSMGVTQKDLAQTIGINETSFRNKMIYDSYFFSVSECILISDELGEYFEDMCKKTIDF